MCRSSFQVIRDYTKVPYFVPKMMTQNLECSCPSMNVPWWLSRCTIARLCGWVHITNALCLGSNGILISLGGRERVCVLGLCQFPSRDVAEVKRSWLFSLAYEEHAHENVGCISPLSSCCFPCFIGPGGPIACPYFRGFFPFVALRQTTTTREFSTLVRE